MLDAYDAIHDEHPNLQRITATVNLLASGTRAGFGTARGAACTGGGRVHPAAREPAIHP